MVTTWRACMGSAYEPAKLLARYEYQIREAYPRHRAWLQKGYDLGLFLCSQALLRGNITRTSVVPWWSLLMDRSACVTRIYSQAVALR